MHYGKCGKFPAKYTLRAAYETKKASFNLKNSEVE